jgi:hypothetical protein
VQSAGPELPSLPDFTGGGPAPAAGPVFPDGMVVGTTGSAVATATSVVAAATTPTPLTGGAKDGKPTMI